MTNQIWNVVCPKHKKILASGNYSDIRKPKRCPKCNRKTRTVPAMRIDKSGRPYHPAKYSKSILDKLSEIIFDDAFVLDCFAGTGLIHSIPSIQAWGLEIEPEWAGMHSRNLVADATKLPFRDGCFPYVVTSCVYGNRTSDHHDAKDASVRNTYKHSLGRNLHFNNAGQMHYAEGPRGADYRQLHRAVWREVWRVLRRGGKFVLNVSNFMKGNKVVNVAGWHKAFIKSLGFELIERHKVVTRRYKNGANRNKRVAHEYIYVFQKP